MEFVDEPEDRYTFEPRQFRLTLISQFEVDEMQRLANTSDQWNPGGVIREFLELLSKRLNRGPRVRS